jgi:hypothetical protein
LLPSVISVTVVLFILLVSAACCRAPRPRG